MELNEEKLKARQAWIEQNKKFLDDIERKKLFLDRVVILCQLVTLLCQILILVRYAS